LLYKIVRRGWESPKKRRSIKRIANTQRATRERERHDDRSVSGDKRHAPNTIEEKGRDGIKGSSKKMGKKNLVLT